jgi:hypothetical protein
VSYSALAMTAALCAGLTGYVFMGGHMVGACAGVMQRVESSISPGRVAWYHHGMSTITVIPDDPRTATTPYRAVSGEKQAVGPTVGSALDGLRSQLGEPSETTLVIVQPMIADGFFPAEQRERLGTLMARWRSARDAGTTLPSDELAELEVLVKAEVHAAGERAAHLLRSVRP